MLHGYGADARDLFSLVDELNPKLLAISIQAPIELPFGGYAWYHLEQTATGLREDPTSRAATEELLASELLEIIHESGGSPSNIFLLGFSQGTAMVYGLLARGNLAMRGLTLRGVAALSGYVPDHIQPMLRDSRFVQLPIFIGHGELDGIVPVKASEIAEELLQDSQSILTNKLYPIAHGISPEELDDLAQWMDAIIE